MEANKYFQERSPEEQQKLVLDISDDILKSEISRRKIRVPLSLVEPTVQDSGLLIKAEQDQSFNNDIERFLNPDINMKGAEQLELMSSFWNLLGLELPTLSHGQKNLIDSAANANSKYRVVPAPLLDFEGRKSIIEKTRNFSANQFHSDQDVLSLPKDYLAYAKLLHNPDSVVCVNGVNYALGYKDSEGHIVNRSTYISSLVDNEQAIEAKNGIVWTFPVMDISINAPRDSEYVLKLNRQIESIISPESLITVQLLRQYSGTPNIDHDVDLANEAVCELDSNSNPSVAVELAGVSWNPVLRQIELLGWNAVYKREFLGVRSAENALWT